MTNRDYTKEVGINSEQKIVPMRYAVTLIVAIVAAAWFGFASVRAGMPAAEKKTASLAAPAGQLAAK